MHAVLGNHDYRGDAEAQLSPYLREIDSRWLCLRSFIVHSGTFLLLFKFFFFGGHLLGIKIHKHYFHVVIWCIFLLLLLLLQSWLRFSLWIPLLSFKTTSLNQRDTRTIGGALIHKSLIFPTYSRCALHRLFFHLCNCAKSALIVII